MEARTINTPGQRLPLVQRIARRRLLLRDGLKFLTLTLVAVVFSTMTTLLFRSFEAHRDALAETWSQRGREALDHGRSKQAVDALRISLSYRPDDHANQLALAQALAASGHINEAENYFLNLWQAQPGSGPINLQLARLERSRGDAPMAINYYRAAVFGTWSGDALERRRDTRLELSNYMIQRGQLQAARAELLIAAGNNPDAATQLAIGDALQSADDARDAMSAYRNAAEDKAMSHTADAKAGELCYRMGDYGCAGELLEKALHYQGWTDEQKTRLTTMQHDSQRLQELAAGSDLAAPVRLSHLINDGRIAQQRLRECLKQQPTPVAGAAPGPLQQAQAQWKATDTAHNRAALLHDDDLQAQFAALVQQTEETVTQTCSAATGDDALILYLHAHPATTFGAQ